ncbi:cytochrome c biogenesis CcdA family protein [Salana multivorans]
MDIGLVSAFLGGALALLSPCAALLLPSFFAATVGSGPRLALHGLVFYAGLATVLVPLGAGVGAVGALLVTHRTTIVVVSAVLLIVLGTLQVLGLGFDPARLVPGGTALQGRATSASGLVKTYLLGAVSAVAGFCAGPILGAVLTLAATRGGSVAGGVLLAVYGAGMVVPLMLIAALWQRLGARGQRVLRGRSVVVLGRRLHTTSIVTGLLIIGVGILFWTTNGLVGTPELVPLDVQVWLQGLVSRLTGSVLDVVVIVGLGAVVLVWWERRRRRLARAAADADADAAEVAGVEE